MYPLKRKPTKLISKVVILLIWICGLLFALPMAYAFTFDYVPEQTTLEEEEPEIDMPPATPRGAAKDEEEESPPAT